VYQRRDWSWGCYCSG